MIAFLTSKLGLASIALMLILGVFGLQRFEIASRDHTISSMKAAQKLAEAEIQTQNAAISAQSSRSSAALSEASKQVAAVAPRSAHFTSQAASLGVYKPQGADRCGMLEDAVLEARRAFQ